MKRILKREHFVYYHIDRIESSYGNVQIRGWAVEKNPSGNFEIYVCDAAGNRLPAYIERLVREDVNQVWQVPADTESGLHLYIERSQVDTPYVWLCFSNGKKTAKEKIIIHAGAVKFRIPGMKKHAVAGMDYDSWIRKQIPDRKEQKRQRMETFPQMPLFSVVIPLYNTPHKFLKEIIDSVMNQTYSRVELCLADGSTDDSVRQYLHKRYRSEKRIRYKKLKENKGISENTNAALKMASGDFIVFADHDDVLSTDAFYEMAKVINQDPDIDMIYSDEDKINRKGNAYFEPHFKPDFDRELICCNNYFCHLVAVRKDVQKKVGLLDPAFDGAQDYDYVLRCVEAAKKIHHIPKVLYHWRTHPDSTAGNPASKQYAFDAGRRALDAHYRRTGEDACAESTNMLGRYRTHRVIKREPLVTILIPNKDHIQDLSRCILSIKEKTVYRNYEILIVENNSTEKETEDYYRNLEQTEENVRVIRYEGDFNFAAIHNYAVPFALGEYVVLLNNDTEVINGEWLGEMLQICQKDGVGAVGAKLFYPDGTIQHAGVVLGMCGVASHIYVGAGGEKDGYVGRLVSVMEYSAVTAACMMTKKAAYATVNGMSEDLAVAYNDIDYCLRLKSAGYHIVYTPYAQLIHYESKTRGLENTPQKQERFQREAGLFRERWGALIEQGDPAYNPNLSLTRTDCALNMEHGQS